jgi:hypothetical protein
MAKLGINTGIVPDDGLGDSLLDGAVKINSNFDDIYSYFGDGTNLTFTGGSSSQWVTTSSGIHTISNVGIGTTNATETLTVVGDARVTGILTVGTASITLDGSSNTITVGSGVTIDGSTGIIEATSLVVGGTTLTGAAVTSITAGTGISVDQSTGNVTISAIGGGESYWEQTSAGIHTLSNVGIGTTNPTSALTVKGNTSLETLSVSGVSTLTTLSIGGTTGSDGQYLRSTGNGITWENFTSLRSVYNYSATESQKEFAAAGINTGFVDVYLNGIRLDDANYSIIEIGVSLNVGAFDGDEVTVIGFNTINASAGGGIGGGISDVSGPGSSTDNAVTRFDGTTGKLIQNSLVTIGDDGAIVAPQAGSIIPFYFDNQAAFPSASTYHGALAHSHADGGMFYAHGGGWIQLADASDISWIQTSAGIHTLSNVGIGTTNPTSVLTVKGDVLFGNPNDGASQFAVNAVGDVSMSPGRLLYLNSPSTSVGLRWTNNFGIEIFNASNLGGDDRNIDISSNNGGKVRLKSSSNTLDITPTGTIISGVSTFSGQSTFDSGIILNGNTSNLSGSQRILLSGGEGGDTVLYNGGIAFSSFIFYSMQGGSTIEVGRLNGSGTLNLPLSQGGINVSGISTLGTVQVSSGIVTASSGIVTYFGDTSNTTDGRWTLGASGTSDYTFTGIGFTQTTNDPVLYLARGRVYEFVNNSGGSHPFQIRVSNGGSAYNDGVTNNGAASGVIRFEIPFNAPNTLYYQCTAHSGMGNTISVYPSTI